MMAIPGRRALNRCRSRAPAAPSSAAIVVIMTDGSAAGTPGRWRPLVHIRSAASAKPIIMIAFFLRCADQDDADEGDDAELFAATMSATSAPTPADGSADRIVIGWI